MGTDLEMEWGGEKSRRAWIKSCHSGSSPWTSQNDCLFVTSVTSPPFSSYLGQSKIDC